jgi:hypothetical protein
LAVKSKPLQATAVAVTAQMIAPLVTMIALASARVVTAAVVVTAARVVIAARVVTDAAEKKSVATVDARVVVTADAKVAAMAARHLPVMAVLPKLAEASVTCQALV